MITKVHMEALSPTMEEGQLVRWLKSEGDEVTNGDVLAEIETDKATMELVARGEGVLRAILLDEGGTAPVGEVIGVIAGADEDISEVAGGAGGGGGGSSDDEAADDEGADDGADDDEGADHEGDAEADSDEGGDDASDEDDGDEDLEESEEPKVSKKSDADSKKSAASKKSASASKKSTGSATTGTGDAGRVKASPLARRLAEDMGVDLASVEGSGPGGRVVKRDVEAARDAAAAEPPAAPMASADEDEYEDVPVSQMRKTIAKRLVQSIGPVPHFFLTIDVDMTRTMQARAAMNALLKEEGRKVSFNDFVLKAAAGALRRHPECNAHWGGDHVRRWNAVHLAVAVAVEDGLITPVIRNAHLKGVARIADEVRELAGRAREKKLKPDEYTGSTFSVSNLGMFGIHEFTAIINPPEAGILAVGGIEDTPVAVDGQVVVRPRMKVTMSCDHRVIDGAQGARFLQTLKAMLEEPATILT